MACVLACALDESTMGELNRLCSRLNLTVIRVDPKVYTCSLRDIVDGTTLLAPPAGEIKMEDPMMIMCGLTRREFDTLLDELKQAHCRIRFKAVMTPTNKRWNIFQLHDEMVKEEAVFLAARTADASQKP